MDGKEDVATLQSVPGGDEVLHDFAEVERAVAQPALDFEGFNWGATVGISVDQKDLYFLEQL